MYFCYKRSFYQRSPPPPYQRTELTTARGSDAVSRKLYESFENSEHVHLLNDVRSPTHIRYGWLDLVFASSRLAPAPAWSLHPTLTIDHFGIVLEVAIRLAPFTAPRSALQHAPGELGPFQGHCQGFALERRS